MYLEEITDEGVGGEDGGEGPAATDAAAAVHNQRFPALLDQLVYLHRE